MEEGVIRAIKFRHWTLKDPMSDGVLLNLQWDYDDGSTTCASQHIPAERLKGEERQQKAKTWRRLRAWRTRELRFALYCDEIQIENRLWPVSVN